MQNDGELILSLLEKTTFELAATLDGGRNEPVDFHRSAVLLAERGDLIERFRAVQSEHEPLSYVDVNRLIIVHALGNQIASAYLVLRARLMDQALDIGRHRAYAGCLNGLVETSPSHDLETA